MDLEECVVLEGEFVVTLIPSLPCRNQSYLPIDTDRNR
jgi:hypothetical protein